MYVLLSSVDINYPIAFVPIPLVDNVQNFQTSDHNANIKAFMHAFVSKYLKKCGNMKCIMYTYITVIFSRQAFLPASVKKKKKEINLWVAGQ